MAVAAGDGHDAGKKIEVAPAGFVEEILHLAFDNHQRIAVQREYRGVHVMLPKGEHGFARRPGVWLGRIVEGRHWYRPGNHVGGHRIDPGVRRSTWWLSSSNGSRTRWSHVR